jgi:hypothetical protein
MRIEIFRRSSLDLCSGGCSFLLYYPAENENEGFPKKRGLSAQGIEAEYLLTGFCLSKDIIADSPVPAAGGDAPVYSKLSNRFQNPAGFGLFLGF